MASFINKNVPNVVAKVETMSTDIYRMWVTYDIFSAQNDYDFNAGKYKVLKVVYPDSFYAIPRYITTKELNDEFRKRGIKTANELVNMLNEMIQI